MLRKIPFETAAPVLERFQLTEEGAQVVGQECTPADALTAMYEAGLLVDLSHFLAHGLPTREAICWATAVQIDLEPEPTPVDAALRDLVLRWIKDPQETTRSAVVQSAEPAQMKLSDTPSPIIWLCNAVCWNGSGSIGPPGGPIVLPPPGLHASALLGAVALLAGEAEERLETTLDAAFARGVEVAQGGWPVLQAHS